MLNPDVSLGQRPLVETILSQMLTELESNDDFQVQNINLLRELIESGDISKPKKVVEALKFVGEKQ